MSEQFYYDIMKILITFFLTSIFGASVAAYFQTRTWNHQRNAQIREEEKRSAINTFETVSKLLDRRLYRYRQIVYALRTENEERIDNAFQDYRDVLYEWNDNLNRNYAMIEIYFGTECRENLELSINKEIIFVGTLLERKKKGQPDKHSLTDVWNKIDYINGLVYSFDKRLLRMIESSEVGRFRTQKD